jgi:hypothetical protein
MVGDKKIDLLLTMLTRQQALHLIRIQPSKIAMKQQTFNNIDCRSKRLFSMIHSVFQIPAVCGTHSRNGRATH